MALLGFLIGDGVEGEPKTCGKVASEDLNKLKDVDASEADVLEVRLCTSPSEPHLSILSLMRTDMQALQ